MNCQVQDDPLSRRLAALREWVATCLARLSKHQCLMIHNFRINRELHVIFTYIWNIHWCLVIGHTKVCTCTWYILQKLRLIWYTFIFGRSLSPWLVMGKCALSWHHITFSQVEPFECVRKRQNFRLTQKYVNILSERWWTLQPRKLWAGSPWWRRRPDPGTRRYIW